jgi:DNA-binding YbaB/EbfC family protein
MAGDFKLNNLMKQAQEMQQKMQQAQKEIESTEVTGESGGGLVKITLNGRHKVIRVNLETAFNEETSEVMEDLIRAAFNDASARIETLSKQKLSALTSGLNLPEGFGGTEGS